MKRIFTVLASILLTVNLFAQSPEKMSYQAVIRNSSDALVANTQVGIQVSILQGSASGPVVYTETQTPITNANGLVSIEIGGGAGFSSIDWANGPYFIKTETDPTGGTSYTITGTSQLLSVPYALHAKTAETVSGGITETDPVFTASQAVNITATDIANLGNLSGVNTGDQDLSGLATEIALSDSTAQVRSEIPDVSGFLTSYSETDPIFISSQAANITTTDITHLSNLSGTNTGDQDLSGLATKTALGDSIAQIRSEIPVAADGSETKVTAGTNVTVTGAGTTANPYVVGGITLTIGQSYQGGIIYWLDASGQHGLISSTADQGTTIPWYNAVNRNTGATGDGLYAGAMNTAMIVATQISDFGSGNFAAKLCADYVVYVDGGKYGDWYLPSLEELYLLYLQQAVVGGFPTGSIYWSSTEHNNGTAFQMAFNGTFLFATKSNLYKVRAIRRF